MVLFIEGKEYSKLCSLKNLEKHIDLSNKSRDFALSTECDQTQNEIAKTIYVHQNEFAVVANNDSNGFHLIGSDEATTCHILVLDNHSAVALAHLDGGKTRESIELMLQELRRYESDNKNYDVYLFGGFIDGSDRDYSCKLSDEILQIFSSIKKDVFELKLASITLYNDHIINGIHFPLIYGICFDVNTKVIRKMNFIDQGPAFRLRSIYQSAHTHPAFCLYSSLNKTITLNQFEVKLSTIQRFYLPLYQYYFHDDGQLLEMTSTSPKQEKPSYLINMKKQILYILHYAKHIPKWFDEQTHSIVFYRHDDKWITDNNKIIDDIEL